MTAPDGREWTVRRRWLPDGWAPRWRRGEGKLQALDALSLGVDDIGGLVIGAFVALAVLAVTVILLPLVVTLVQVALAVVVLVVALGGRVILRKPWRVVARTRSAPSETRAWHVTGFLRSRRVIRELRGALKDGRPVDPAGATSVPTASGDW